MLGYALIYEHADKAVVQLVLRLRFELRVDELDGIEIYGADFSAPYRPNI